MIDASNHIELNGVKYRIAEGSGQAAGYVLSGEPLRPPNSVVVQGENSANQKFQARSDVMLWTVTDWSGGEGQIKFDAQVPERAYELVAVDPFTEPGKLMPGYYVEVTDDNADVDLNKTLTLAVGTLDSGVPVLWGLDKNSANVYKWDTSNTRWGTATATGGTVGAVETATGDAGFIYWKETTTANVYKYDGTTFTVQNSDTGVTHEQAALAQLGAYIYLFEPTSGKTWEIPKTGTPPVASTLIDDPSAELPYLQNLDGECTITAGANRIYTMLNVMGEVVIRSIVPTSAAGTGYAEEIARIPGVYGEAIWWNQGQLFVTVNSKRGLTGERAVLYLHPATGQYGTLGRVRPTDTSLGQLVGASQGQQLLSSYMVSRDPGPATGAGVFAIDIVTGSFAQIAHADAWASSSEEVTGLVAFGDDVFFSVHGDAASGDQYTYRMVRSQYEGDDAYALSPWHDFGLADEKLLSSVVLHTEALPASWAVNLSYATDGGTSFTSIGTYSTTSGTGTRYAVSTDSSAITFRSLQIKIGFTWSGGGVPTTRPKVLAVEARSQVAKPQRVWRLNLDLSTDRSGRGGESREGSQKIDNISSAGQSASVVDFKDGYTHPDPNTFDQYDVVVDEYNIILEQPGEGLGQVTLREVA